MTDDQIARVHFYWISYSHLPVSEIAKKVGISPGEVMNIVRSIGRISNASR